jgi:hypothetical protein
VVHVFFVRATNGRTMKKKYERVAPNIRRTVFNPLNFSNEFAYLPITLATIQTQKIIAYVSDVITYPLIQETFAFVKSNLECEIDRQYFGVGFRSKQI